MRAGEHARQGDELGRQVGRRAQHGGDAAAEGQSARRRARRRRPLAPARPERRQGGGHGQHRTRAAAPRTVPGRPGVTGATSTQPGRERRPPRRARAPWRRPPRSRHRAWPRTRGHPLGHDHRHAVGPPPCHHGVRHPRQRLHPCCGRLRVDVDERRVATSPAAPNTARDARVRGAAHRDVAQRQERGVQRQQGDAQRHQHHHPADDPAEPATALLAQHRHPSLPHPGMHDGLRAGRRVRGAVGRSPGHRPDRRRCAGAAPSGLRRCVAGRAPSGTAPGATVSVDPPSAIDVPDPGDRGRSGPLTTLDLQSRSRVHRGRTRRRGPRVRRSTPVRASTSARTWSISRHTSSAEPPVVGLDEVGVLVGHLGRAQPQPLQPAASTSRPAESPAGFVNTDPAFGPAGLVLTAPADDLGHGLPRPRPGRPARARTRPTTTTVAGGRATECR